MTEPLRVFIFGLPLRNAELPNIDDRPGKGSERLSILTAWPRTGETETGQRGELQTAVASLLVILK